jgi:hypothetical protein
MAAPWLGPLLAALTQDPPSGERATPASDRRPPTDPNPSPWAAEAGARGRLRFVPFGYRGWRCWL